jgi:hypothetical protein
MRKPSTFTSRVALGLLTAALVLVGLAGVSSAAPSRDQSASAPVGQPSVLNGNAVTAASELHLTVEQQTTLERQIAGQLQAVPNATRVSLNELAWTDGGVRVVLTVPVPGMVVPLAADCPFQWVCVYQNQDFGYPRAAFFHCGNAAIPTTIGVSSWHNNQTNNTASWLLNASGTSLQNTRALSKVSFVGAPSNDQARIIHVC